MRLAPPSDIVAVPVPWTHIVRRDGNAAPCDPERIQFAIARAGQASGEFADAVSARVTADVLEVLARRFPATPPAIEDIQDEVEWALMRAGLFRAARAYII